MTGSSRFLLLLPLILMATPALAQQPGITLATVIGDAAPAMKLVMLLLMIGMAASVVIAVRKIMAGPALVGGSSFLSALRLGGPLIGLLGAAFNGLTGFMAIARFGAQPIQALAPGLAEAALLLVLGLLTGVVAVIAHWAVESRIDRAVLRP